MSIPLMGLVLTSTMTDAAEVAVLACLADHANDYGESCFAGIPRIARLVRQSERNVTRILKKLETGAQIRSERPEDLKKAARNKGTRRDLGAWITVQRGNGAGRVAQYKLNMEKLKGCQDVTLQPKSRHLPAPKEGRHGVTLFSAKRVTPEDEKGDNGARKGDNGDLHSKRTIKANRKATGRATGRALEFLKSVRQTVRLKARCVECGAEGFREAAQLRLGIALCGQCEGAMEVIVPESYAAKGATG